MTTTFQQHMQSLKANALQEHVETWNEATVQGQDLQDVIAACLRVPEEMEQVWKQAEASARANPALLQNGDPWVEVQNLFRAFSRALTTVREKVHSFEAKGHAIPQVPELDKAISRLRRLDQSIFQGLDVASVWRAEAQAERGETYPLEEVLARLASRG